MPYLQLIYTVETMPHKYPCERPIVQIEELLYWAIQKICNVGKLPHSNTQTTNLNKIQICIAELLYWLIQKICRVEILTLNNAQITLYKFE